MYEKALAVFEKYELQLFFKLKAGDTIHMATLNKIIKEIEFSGLPREYAERFTREQVYDMCEQIAEQSESQ